MRLHLLCLLLLPSLAFCQVYKETAPDGSVTFTDKPTGKGTVKKIRIRAIQTYQAPKVETQVEETPASNETLNTAAIEYEALRVVAPKPNESIWSAPGKVVVTADAEPPLAKGHRYAFYLDASLVGEPSANRILTINNVYRGRHTVQVKIVDEGGETLKASDEVIFYVHRPNLNTRPFSENTPQPLLPKITSLPIIKNVIRGVSS